MRDVSRETREKLECFATVLTLWNTRINLVSPRDLVNLWSRHIEDSLQLVSYLPAQATVTDLGSGGGFPGLILAIATGCPVTLIESDLRKCAFLREAGRLCGANIRVVSQRIETVSLPLADVVTARALAPLKQLLDWARPLLKPEGVCLFLKGAKAADELTEARQGWHITTELLKSNTADKGVIIKVCDFQRVI